MAGDASLRLRDLLDSGYEIPYEVRESGPGSPLAEYVPQTSQFIRECLSQLSELDSFGMACSAMESQGLTGPYLEEMGVPVPGDARRRGEIAGIVFLCRLWQGSSDFTLDDLKLNAAIEELVDMGEASLGEVEIVVPLRGFQMDTERLELANASIVRSDTVDVPAEARGAEGMGGAGWEPTFLAVTTVDGLETSDDGSDVGVRAVEAFKRIVTTLRLFKAGGVALGPHAWVKAGGDRWRRVATGAGKVRPGGYRLADSELGDLAAFSRGLGVQTTPFSRAASDIAVRGFPATLMRAISRFEAGLERSVTLEALNDYLLTLRFMLEGGGPAGLSMSMRVGALCAEPDGRTEVKATIDRAAALERELWSGEPAMGFDKHKPSDVSAEVEDLTRAILRDAALGHLGSELRITADEILLGEGLSIGEGAGASARGETAEWGSMSPDDLFDDVPEADPEFAAEGPVDDEAEAFDDPGDLEEELERALGGLKPHETATHHAGGQTPSQEAHESGTEEPAPAPVGPQRQQNLIHDLQPDAEFEWQEPTPREERAPEAETEREPVTPPVPTEETPTGRFRVLRSMPDGNPVSELIADSADHQRQVTSRVSFLFPRPETTEWSVGEVGYDRNRRAQPNDPTAV